MSTVLHVEETVETLEQPGARLPSQANTLLCYARVEIRPAPYHLSRRFILETRERRKDLVREQLQGGFSKYDKERGKEPTYNEKKVINFRPSLDLWERPASRPPER